MATRLFSTRLQEETFGKLELRTHESGESKAHLARQLIEEGLRMEAHPGIIFKPDLFGRRAAVSGGPAVWQIIPVVQNEEASGDDPIEAAAEYFGLPAFKIRAALGYYAEYREEIDARIRCNSQLAEWLREQERVAG